MTIPAAMNSLRKEYPEIHRISEQHHGVLTPAALWLRLTGYSGILVGGCRSHGTQRPRWLQTPWYPETIGAADPRDAQRSWWLQIYILPGNHDDCSLTARKDGNYRPLSCPATMMAQTHMYSGTVTNSGPHGAQSLCRFAFYALRCCYVVDLQSTDLGIPGQGYSQP